MSSVKELPTTNSSNKYLLPVIAGFVFIVTFVVLMLSNQATRERAFTFLPWASEGTPYEYNRPTLCDRCDQAVGEVGNGVSACLDKINMLTARVADLSPPPVPAWIDYRPPGRGINALYTAYNQYSQARTAYFQSTEYRNWVSQYRRTYQEFLKELNRVRALCERNCNFAGSTLSKRYTSSGQGSSLILNEDDVVAYRQLCVIPFLSPTPTPPPPTATPIPVVQPSPSPDVEVGCTACDFDNDQHYGYADSVALEECVFNTSVNMCMRSDVNSDGLVNAADSNLITNIIYQGASATEYSTGVGDVNGDGVVNAGDISAWNNTYLSGVCVRDQVVRCINADVNNDRVVDAGDMAWCALKCQKPKPTTMENFSPPKTSSE